MINFSYLCGHHIRHGLCLCVKSGPGHNHLGVRLDHSHRVVHGRILTSSYPIFTILRVLPTLGLARSKSRFCYHVKELTQTNSNIPENRPNSVLSGRQRPLNVEKTAFRRSQFRPIKSHSVENFFILGCS